MTSFTIEAVVEGDQILLKAPGLNEAIALSGLLQTASERLNTTIAHPCGESARVYDSDNYGGETFLMDRYLSPDVRRFMGGTA